MVASPFKARDGHGSGMPQYQTVNLGLRPDQIEDLDELADDDEVDSRAAAVRDAVDDFLDGR